MGKLTGLRYGVVAFNTATASTNKIHDDEVARGFGFRGGLVPGVDVYAYLCHLPAERWGRDWLERGTMTARFRSPVYDGDAVEVTGELDDGDGDQEMALELRDSGGEICAIARATLPAGLPGGRPADQPDAGEWPAGEPPADPPPVSAEAITARPFGQLEATFHAAQATAYLDDVREDLALFRERGPAHPGWLLRYANYVLSSNVRLGPWIHTESTVQHWSVVEDGEIVSTRALVTGVRERNGHEIVDLDVLQHVSGRAVARTAHSAIYRLRSTGDG
jgi:acyl dehydratase